MKDWKYLKYDVEYWWQEFNLRTLLEANPLIAISCTAISLIILLLVIFSLSGSKPTAEYEPVQKAWYYDLNTGKLFTEKANLPVPTAAPSGSLPDGSPAGALAFVYSYNRNGDEPEDKFAAFVAIDDPNSNIDASQAKNWLEGKLIKAIDSNEWVPFNSIEGREILDEKLKANSEGVLPRVVLPD